MREKLDELEEIFESLETKQYIALYVGIFAFLGVAWFYFYFDDAQTNLALKEQKIAQYKTKIQKINFRSINKKILDKKSNILKEKSHIAQLKSKIYHMDQKLRAERFLSVTQKGVATFVDRMLESSLKQNLLIQNIEIKDYNATYIGILKGQREMSVVAQGDFLNIVHFLRSLEESVMLMGLSSVVIETNGTVPVVETNIRFYGIQK
jgi:hypothetical protein